MPKDRGREFLFRISGVDDERRFYNLVKSTENHYQVASSTKGRMIVVPGIQARFLVPMIQEIPKTTNPDFDPYNIQTKVVQIALGFYLEGSNKYEVIYGLGLEREYHG